MLRHCPIPLFASSGSRKKMPKASGKEKAPLAIPESQALDIVADPKVVVKVAKEPPLPPQKVLRIFSINIITQGLPFCRRRVSAAGLGPKVC